MEKIQKLKEDCFFSPLVLFVKEDKSFKFALDSKKVFEGCIKRRLHMPKMEELLSQISTEKARRQNESLLISKIDLEYACSKLKLSKEACRHCSFVITGRNMNKYDRFKKRFYGLSDIPIIFQEKMDRTLNYQTPEWLHDITLVQKRG